jgi:hypothetical protein
LRVPFRSLSWFCCVLFEEKLRFRNDDDDDNDDDEQAASTKSLEFAVEQQSQLAVYIS